MQRVQEGWKTETYEVPVYKERKVKVGTRTVYDRVPAYEWQKVQTGWRDNPAYQGESGVSTSSGKGPGLNKSLPPDDYDLGDTSGDRNGVEEGDSDGQVLGGSPDFWENPFGWAKAKFSQLFNKEDTSQRGKSQDSVEPSPTATPTPYIQTPTPTPYVPTPTDQNTPVPTPTSPYNYQYESPTATKESTPTTTPTPTGTPTPSATPRPSMTPTPTGTSTDILSTPTNQFMLPTNTPDAGAPSIVIDEIPGDTLEWIEDEFSLFPEEPSPLYPHHWIDPFVGNPVTGPIAVVVKKFLTLVGTGKSVLDFLNKSLIEPMPPMDKPVPRNPEDG